MVVVTFRSMSFFHNILSEIKLSQGLHTSSAAQSDFASRYSMIFSATWSSPFLGSREIKSRCNIGLRKAFTVPCW